MIKCVKLAASLSSIAALAACQPSVTGDELCDASAAEVECGIAVAACNERLAADGQFRLLNVYTGWGLSLGEDDHCLLSVTDTGATTLISPGIGRSVTFDLGPADLASLLMGDRDTDGDGFSNEGEAESGTDPQDPDSDDDGDSDGDEIACGSSPLDPAQRCPES